MTDKEYQEKIAVVLNKLAEQLVAIMENNNFLLKENLRLWEEITKLKKDGYK